MKTQRDMSVFRQVQAFQRIIILHPVFWCIMICWSRYLIPCLLYLEVGLQGRSESIIIGSRPRLYLYLANLQDLSVKAY
jgi:hypothetical protein